MNEDRHAGTNSDIDVCLILEGTYPYVRGGVSTWVQQIIGGMPQLRFGIVYLGAEQVSSSDLVFELPDNIVHIQSHSIISPDKNASAGPPSLRTRIKQWSSELSDRRHIGKRLEYNAQLHQRLASAKSTDYAGMAAGFTNLLIGDSVIRESDLQEHAGSWQTILSNYHSAPEGLDFNHYFWTVRGMHAPVFRLADIAEDVPPARLYHAVSTGYAGYLGTLLKHKTGRPFLLTEHGIYTKERELDLAQVSWIPTARDPHGVGLHDHMDHLRQVWIRFFTSLGKMAYASCDQIYTLYEGNRQRQISDGAPDNKIRIIPNGVEINRFSSIRRAADAPVPPILVLMGRVVSIKDIKTFIRAIHIARQSLPDIQGWICGPEEEDPDYANECHELVKSLGVEQSVQFKGYQRPEDIFPQAGLCVLTSVSEGQPLVVLEAYAAGIPSLTTTVGSCEELALGTNEADRALGAAGRVVPISDPAAVAQAAVAMLTDEHAWRRASAAAIIRANRYYNLDTMISHYAAEYTRFVEADSAPTVISQQRAA